MLRFPCRQLIGAVGTSDWWAVDRRDPSLPGYEMLLSTTKMRLTTKLCHLLFPPQKKEHLIPFVVSRVMMVTEAWVFWWFFIISIFVLSRLRGTGASQSSFVYRHIYVYILLLIVRNGIRNKGGRKESRALFGRLDGVGESKWRS